MEINFIYLHWIILIIILAFLYWYIEIYSVKKYMKTYIADIENPLNKKPMLRNNFMHITGSFYLVKTQAGFKHAIRRYTENSRKIEVKGYPTSYPSIVCFSQGYNGNIFVRVDTVHAKKMLSVVRDA